eukprot:ANDGO_05119.mRNA.1 Bardet-Biedl syndrome 2 protein homolog
MLTPCFSISLPPLSGRPRLATTLSTPFPSLAALSLTGTIIVHSPSNPVNPVSQLSFNRPVSCLSAGAIDPEDSESYLLIGSETSVSAYSVQRNADLFYRDVADGVSQLCFGRIGSVSQPLAVSGGNCSIQGFDHTGTERFWTVTGDNVSSLALIDVDEDGQNELLVGSEDYCIRIFQEEKVLSEVQESDTINELTGIRFTRYGFSLSNGSIGCYDGNKRLWKAKSKSVVNSIQGFDLDGDGQPELLAGFSSGRLEVRNASNGDLVFKDTSSSAITSILKERYRSDGKETVLVLAENGELRGFLPISGSEADDSFRMSNVEDEFSQRMADISRKRDELAAELKSYDESLKKAKDGVVDGKSMPSDLRIHAVFLQDVEQRKIFLQLKTNYQGVVIRMATVQAESIFPGGDYVVSYFDAPSSEAVIDLPVLSDTASRVCISAFVGQLSASQFSVINVGMLLPRFLSFVSRPCDKTRSVPESFVRFMCSERPNRILLWIRQSFLWVGDVDANVEDVDLLFVSLRTGLDLRITRTKQGEVLIRIDDMAVCADVVSDFLDFIKVEEMECESFFPREAAFLKNLLFDVDEKNDTRLKLAANMADVSQQVKQLLVGAEDSRLLGDMRNMSKMYSHLMVLNRNLMAEHQLRSANHSALLGNLKIVNQMIQNCAKMRAGTAKSRIVSDARKSIKSNRFADLFQILRYGKA